MEKEKTVNGKEINFRMNNEEPLICELENKDVIRIIPIITSIIMPLDERNNPLLDPRTKKSIILLILASMSMS
ncbi:MAG: hypothetical protein LVQ96_04440 [Thermoplasmatales archaeon]|nr:hypothetical protein [Thermoplasmatales archaeon]